jgi:uncharacterized protein (TIGR03382 family)
MRASVAAFVAVAGLAAAANAQQATFSVVMTPGVVGNNALVNGVVRVSWTDAAGVGYAGGAFRLRFNDSGNNFAAANVVTPSNSNNGINSETTAQRVGVTAGELPTGAGTVADSWTSGRRPKRAYLADATDPSSIQSGGGFRFPPNGPGATDMHYSVESQSGVLYLTGRNGASVENRIEHAQIPRSLQPDPLFFDPGTSIDLFKFQVRSPATGLGTVTITPEVLSASIFISDAGAQHMLTANQISATGGTFAYSPSPSTLALLGLGGLVAGRRRR